MINNLRIFALSFSFLFYAIGIITGLWVSLHIELTQQNDGIQLKRQLQGQLFSVEIIVIAYWFADVVLAIVLWDIIIS